MSDPKHSFLYRRRVEFADTDVAGIMHFANFFRFMEVTEHAFFRSLKLSVFPVNDDVKNGVPDIGWPRIHVEADYKLPLQFEEEVDIELLVKEIGKQKIEYFFRFWKNPDSDADRVLAATGRFKVVCVKFDADSRSMKAVSIPEEIRGKIAVAPAELLPEKTAL